MNPENASGKDDMDWCWDWGWGSYKCRCQMTMPDCTPTDFYDTILECDNVYGTEDLGEEILGDKISCTVGLVNYFYRDRQIYKPQVPRIRV